MLRLQTETITYQCNQAVSKVLEQNNALLSRIKDLEKCTYLLEQELKAIKQKLERIEE